MTDRYCRQSPQGTAWLLGFFFVLSLFLAAPSSALTLEQMQEEVTRASTSDLSWGGPITGPTGRTGIRIAIICEELRNGGILGVAQGLNEALNVMGWQFSILNAGGTARGREIAMEEAMALPPDGIILVGIDGDGIRKSLAPLAEQGLPVVGWHTGIVPGAMENHPIAMNISTDPLKVARVTASAAVIDSGGKAGVVIFTDSSFKIATAKARAMADVIRACKGCDLLEIRDIAISRIQDDLPQVIRDLLARYGNRWTHALAINDIFFDYTAPVLIQEGETSRDIRFLSAGDGSAPAFMRIQSGVFQIGTVAEPLNMQGWQLVDELNRLLASEPVSGYIPPVHLISQKNIIHDVGAPLRYDPDNGYRDIYKSIWKR